MIWETRTIEHDGLCYVVQARQCLDGSIQQRHIWFKTQAGDHEPPWVNDWIPSCSRNLGSVIRNMRPAPHVLDESGELIAALQDIAAGHNDPRHRAQDVLEKLKLAVDTTVSAR